MKLLAQPNEWTWIKGDNDYNNPGVYGTQGISSYGNKPGGRYGSVSWTDTSGNFWMFGGSEAALYPYASRFLNDLWKYNTITNQWVWMKGDTTTNIKGIYGIKGIPATSNKPGARERCVSWTDTSGNLWLFGGWGFAASQFGELNDLWKYNIETNEWVWMKGDSTFSHSANYGVKGIPASTNKPQGRYASVCWSDSFGDLWVFGGKDFSGEINDLWKYIAATNEWVWMKGDITTRTGNYGVQGISAATNAPGARFQSAGWKDASGNFWLFGGFGYGDGAPGTFTYGTLNDLWKYDVAKNEWVWMKGDNTFSLQKFGVYGTQGIAAATNKPPATSGSITWTDASGNLWLFGGTAWSTNGYGAINELWNYNTITNEWVWMRGDSTVNNSGNYGTRGVTAATNKPPASTESISWVDVYGNLWLFGGTNNPRTTGTSTFNHLWKYNVTKYPSVAITSPINNSSFSAGSAIFLNTTAADIDGTITKVEFYNYGAKFLEDNKAPFEFVGNDVEPGNYVITARATDNNSATSLSDTVRITVTACTPLGTISADGYTNIPGGKVSDLTSHPSYPNSPAVTAQLGHFEYGPDYGENYGARVRGYICIPQTGYYTFYIAGDDQSGLWLSTDENPANKVLIAYTETWVNFRSWFTYPTQKSAPIRLIKGARYYIESLHKEAIGPDHLSVAWTLPDATFEAPIPGSRLSPWGSSGPGGVRAPGFREAMVEATQGFSVKATPNPSSTHFTLITKSDRNEFITVSVTDIMGRVVESRSNIAANGTIQFGSKYHRGVYFVEVRQGTRREKLKLVRH